LEVTQHFLVRSQVFKALILYAGWVPTINYPLYAYINTTLVPCHDIYTSSDKRYSEEAVTHYTSVQLFSAV